MTTRSGQCACGAVRFSFTEPGNFGICHCAQCQKWLGGPMLAVTVQEADMSIEGAGHIAARRTSTWATRSRCGTCGSPLWYRYDKGVDGAGNYEVPIGLLDDANGLTLRREIFIEAKPDCFDFAGEHPRLTKSDLNL